MARMTEEEASYWDEYYTQNPPKIDPAKKGGMFTRQRELLDTLDTVSADYIRTKAAVDHKLPTQIIGDLVRREIALNAEA